MKTMREKSSQHAVACSASFFFFLIREETGTDVTGSQTGCCDYNTMKMPGCVMDTERPKSRALACATECGWESAPARRCECGDGGKRYQAGSGNRWPRRERPLTAIARMFFPSMCGSSPFQTPFFFFLFFKWTHTSWGWGCLGQRADRMSVRGKTIQILCGVLIAAD